MDFDEPVVIPIDGELDLHTFRPAEVKPLLHDYVQECLQRGIGEVRIIHGKGRGVLRQSVHSVLAKMPEVESFHLAEERRGGWGATIAVLRPRD